MRCVAAQPIPPGRPVATVVLRHVTRAGAHFDWLLEDPAAPTGRGRLVTFRLAIEPAKWPTDRPILATRLADHRRAYLRYEGPISDDRGRVVRLDAGRAIVHRFSPAGLDATLGLRQFAGRVRFIERGAVWVGRRQGEDIYFG